MLEASYGLTRRGGRLVTLSAPLSAQRAEQLGIHAMFFVVTPDAAQLSRLAARRDQVPGQHCRVQKLPARTLESLYNKIILDIRTPSRQKRRHRPSFSAHS